MDNWLSRTELLLGIEKLEKLKSSGVLVVGLGGVGSYAAEMICRAGVGRSLSSTEIPYIPPTVTGSFLR